MKRFLGIFLPSTLTALLATAAMPQSAGAFQTENATYVERATTDAVTDLGAQGDSVGDLLTFANEIYDEHNN